MYTSPSGKSYIGQTFHEKARKAAHRNTRVGGCTAFQNACRKYGFDNMKYVVLHRLECTVEHLNELEQKEIAERNSMVPNGYNLRAGGSNCFASEETKRRQSASLKGRIISEEARRKTSETLKGRKIPREQVERMSRARMGHKVSEETRAKIRAKNKGVKPSASAIAGVVKRCSKAIQCVETGIVYPSAQVASLSLGLTRSAVNSGMTRGNKKCGGFHWEYVNE